MGTLFSIVHHSSIQPLACKTLRTLVVMDVKFDKVSLVVCVANANLVPRALWDEVGKPQPSLTLPHLTVWLPHCKAQLQTVQTLIGLSTMQH
ncbi:hypothetical protein OS493_010910 [Desmophyllum pertusum]|uniref:Uncharacterized protein n=1 Tax=Desmophyllum pertusum TaxID=174260 RepID=A0A9W9ZGS2_9CNID|nr:hypothetical protein OS493_010910 [Desmophyllum pertusum]